MQTTKSNWWQGLTVQPIVILAILIALIIWLSTAQFTNTELATLTLSNLLNLTVQHLELTAVSIVVVLIIAIPLGILLTRKPLRWLTTPVMSLANLG